MKKGLSNDLIFIIITIFFVAIMIVAINQKKVLHIDEYYSYSCANHADGRDGGKALEIEKGYLYEPAESVFLQIYGVPENQKLSYAHIWKNLSENCHVPFYYVILHSICAIFPGTFSFWYAGIINIVFAIITLFFFRKIITDITRDDRFSLIACGYFSLCYGIMDAIIFFRMYIIAMCMATVIMWLLVSHVENDFKFKELIVLFVMSIITALTHYYCIFFLVLACFGYGLVLLVDKRIKAIIKFAITMILAAIASVVIYPPMLSIMDSMYRGKESMDNLAGRGIKEYMGYLAFYLQRSLNVHLFGYCLLFVVIAFGASVVSYVLKRKKFNGNILRKIFCLSIPCVLYFLLIAKVSVMKTARYMYLLYPSLLILGFCMIHFALVSNDRLIKAKRKDTISITLPIGMCIVMLLCAYIGKGPLYHLFGDSNQVYEAVQSHKGSDVVCLYEKENNLRPQFSLIEDMNSIVFAKYAKPEKLDKVDISKSDKIVLMLEKPDENGGAEIFTNRFPSYKLVEELGSYWNVNYYYLESE